jgi:protein involved in polysaccharide export with SLBB domain
MNRSGRAGLAVAALTLACAFTTQAVAQAPSQQRPKTADGQAAVQRPPAQTPSIAAGGGSAADDQMFKDIYREFYNTYKLGPADEIAIRVVGQPDYTLERVKVSPTGSVYHPLLGDLQVAGLTITQLVDRLTKDLSEYLINPKVSASLIEANSGKVGVLGDVQHPGILVMNKPMNVLDAISASGGFADTGDRSAVNILRQTADGRAQTMKVNIKRVLEGKAGAEENITLQPGDTVIVNGNAKKKLAFIMSMTGFGNFLYVISARGR